MFCALKKFLMILAAVWVVFVYSVIAESSVNAAMQMPDGTHEHSGNMPGMEESMADHDGHEREAVSEKEGSIHTEHMHDNGQVEAHEHQHDQRTMGKPGEGPDWPLIEGFAFFNILVLIGAGFMKWKKKENVQ